MLRSHGDRLLAFAAAAETTIVLIAPFVKAQVISRILKAAPVDVPVILYTRWRLEEIGMGVSDIGVWPLLHEDGRGDVRLCHHLHAKCYIFDQNAVVGSANLTSRALNWHPQANLELQVDVETTHASVRDLVKTLDTTAVTVDRGIYEEYRRLLELVDWPVDRSTPAMDPIPRPQVASGWLPESRHPADLFLAYCGKLEELTRASEQSATNDLDYLGLPPGLDQDTFNQAVRSVLTVLPFFRQVEEYSHTLRRFGEYKTLARNYLSAVGLQRNPSDAWQTCIRWLLHFMGDRYHILTPRYSELLARHDMEQDRDPQGRV